MGAAMTDVPFDLTDPPEEPPPAVRQLVMWRVAICLFRDHAPRLAGAGELARCRACGQVWPCRCRRFAERALVDACSESEESETNAPVHDHDDGGEASSVAGCVDQDPR
jgi:hypothetical protein